MDLDAGSACWNRLWQDRLSMRPQRVRCAFQRYHTAKVCHQCPQALDQAHYWYRARQEPDLISLVQVSRCLKAEPLLGWPEQDVARAPQGDGQDWQWQCQNGLDGTALDQEEAEHDDLEGQG